MEISKFIMGKMMTITDTQQVKMLELIKKLNIFDERFGGEIRRGNIFAAAGLTRQEVRHSTILAFLLDPKGWHGIGNFLLRRLVHKASEKKDVSEKLKISYLKLDEAIIKTEVSISGGDNGRIDVLATLKENGLTLTIENKVDASQGRNQLKKYREWVNDHNSKESTNLFIYLTLGPDMPDDEVFWVNMQYAELVKYLEESLIVYSDAIPIKGKIYIEEYIDLIKRFIMNDDSAELAEYCKQLWKNYKPLLNKIFEYELSTNIDAINLFLKDTSHVVLIKNKNSLHFLPSNLIEVIPVKDLDPPWDGFTESYPLRFMFNFNQKADDNVSISLIVYVGPVKDLSYRDALIGALRSRIEQPKRSRENARLYTRIWSASSETFSSNSTYEDLTEKMRELMNKAITTGVIEKIKDSFQSIQIQS